MVIHWWFIIFANIVVACYMRSIPNLILAIIFAFVEIVIKPWYRGDYHKEEKKEKKKNDSINDQ